MRPLQLKEDEEIQGSQESKTERYCGKVALRHRIGNGIEHQDNPPKEKDARNADKRVTSQYGRQYQTDKTDSGRGRARLYRPQALAHFIHPFFPHGYLFHFRCFYI